MPETMLYNALERMTKAAESNNYGEVCTANEEFTRLLNQEFDGLPYWIMQQEILRYEGCANSAVWSVAEGPARQGHLQKMREEFSEIPKPN